MNKRVKILGAGRPVKLTIAALVLACLAGPVSPAHAAVGAGCDTTLDPGSERFITGCANYVIIPSVNSSHVTVVFECHAIAGPDASQTRIRASWENGCVLYKGSQIWKAEGQSAPGPATATAGTASVDLAIPGRFQLCWRVAATYLANGGLELSNADCTQLNLQLGRSG